MARLPWRSDASWRAQRHRTRRQLQGNPEIEYSCTAVRGNSPLDFRARCLTSACCAHGLPTTDTCRAYERSPTPTPGRHLGLAAGNWLTETVDTGWRQMLLPSAGTRTTPRTPSQLPSPHPRQPEVRLAQRHPLARRHRRQRRRGRELPHVPRAGRLGPPPDQLLGRDERPSATRLASR
jgi:hypothetical protein